MQRLSFKIISTVSLIFIASSDGLLAAQEPKIRVLLREGKELSFRADGIRPLLVRGIDHRKKKIKYLRVLLENGKLKVFMNRDLENWTKPLNDNYIKLWTRDPRGVWLGKRRYSGELWLLNTGGTLKVVNHLGIEKYLKSVVGSEMPKDWPIEALRAQAVAARTYALNQLKNKPEYDVDSSVSSQVYLGIESETLSTQKAVDSTRSLVIMKNGKLIDAVFHSSSGGQTEESVSVWGKHRSYLISVPDYDQNNPHYKWEKKFSPEKLKEIFFKIGGVNAIRIVDKTRTNRVLKAKIYGPKGSLRLTGKQIRRVLDLKSTLIKFEMKSMKNSHQNKQKYFQEDIPEIKKKEAYLLLQPPSTSYIYSYPPSIPIPSNDYLLVKGAGSGHGVGMSQWGAKNMAEKGSNFKRILSHFYKGITITSFE
ncbi:SpoIID/LytB domain-containing protein [Prochlorococcus marinus]|uniref:SpoIID/LytB domain-containing protein n=1 Tax=Prochlorococcus marinus TaxID=1219 RepID=UPI0022B55E72|nr:SpoIID/LytB domain-containing protein [Prochlorococcus marinus]